jgi:hypothetical protein
MWPGLSVCALAGPRKQIKVLDLKIVKVAAKLFTRDDQKNRSATL